MQSAVWQSVASEQDCPTGHLAQPPPQSTPVSVPSFVPLVVQTGAVHTSRRQFDTVQSESTLHAFPFAHAAQVPPPQSTSVSLPFLTPSEQLGWHTLFVQTLLTQSVPAPQAFPSAQVGHVPPPQSTSVSALSFAPSAQDQPHWFATPAPPQVFGD